jgi:hypothetical protein
MKTTIELPDALASEAKALAHRSGTTLRDLVVSGLRRELAERQDAPRVDFTFPTATGTGLVADLEPGHVISRSYGLPQ